jgi:FkbM family methyltransferase
MRLAVLKIDVANELKIVFRFVQVFGARGLYIFYRYALLRRGIGKSVQVVMLPQAPTPLRLRTGSSDPEVFYQVFAQKAYDFGGSQQYSDLQRVYGRAVSNGELPLIVDCGANIGITSIWYALHYPKARIYAIEPDADNFDILQANVKAYPNIVPLHAAIWNRSAAVRIINESAPAWAFRVDEDLEGGIATVTVSDIMRLAGATKIFLIKIDIEGFEQVLFRDNIGWMEFTTAIVIELHDWMLPGAGSSIPFVAALAQHPFEIVLNDRTMFCIKIPLQTSAKSSDMKLFGIDRVP